MRNFIFLGIAVVIVAIIYSRFISKDYYGYDEADYSFAAAQGMYANWIDRTAVPFAAFVQKGLAMGLQKSKTTDLSEYVRSSNDITFYRHYHGPLYFYALVAFHAILGGDEYAARWTSLLIFLVGAVVIYGCCTVLSPGASGRVAGLLASMMFLSSQANIATATQITPHALFFSTALITLFFFARWLQARQQKYWYSATAALAFSFMTIEYGLLLLVTVVICQFLLRREQIAGDDGRQFRRLVLVSLGVFVATILIFWPGGWLKLSLLRNYVFFAYFTFVRGSSYGAQSFPEVWWDRVLASPIHYAIIIPAVIAAIINRRRFPEYLPFLVYAALILVTTLRNTSPSPTYISSLLPPVFVVSGLVVARYREHVAPNLRISAVAVVLLALTLHTAFVVFPVVAHQADQKSMRAVITFLRENTDENRRMFVDRRFLPTLHFYFPDQNFATFSEQSESVEAIVARIAEQAYSAVLYGGSRSKEFEDALHQRFVFTKQRIAPLSPEQEIDFYQISQVSFSG